MRPWVVAVALALLMSLVSTCYFFHIPDDLKKKDNQRVGRWGPPNAEFNWCESDYEVADWLAEPVNTISCLVLVLLPASFLAMHDATTDVVVINYLEVVIAIGSMLFHASLRYTMQLADEIPMLWYMVAVGCSCLFRVQGIDATRVSVAWSVAVTIAVLMTEQHSLLHEAIRGMMTITFCVCLVLTGWGCTAMIGRLKEEMAVSASRQMSEKQRKTVHSLDWILEGGLMLFVASVLAWLMDNYFCPVLRQLPGGLPYPQLHTWWHVLVAGVLHCIVVILQADSRRSSDKLEIRYVAGFLPVVHG